MLASPKYSGAWDTTHPSIVLTERTGHPLPPEKPALECFDCEGGIYEGQEYYAIGKLIYCRFCIENYREVAA